ncbi:MAG: nitrous oxide-stimulated promoter family protein [Dehalococcoidales bacterium]|nr:nitrous oxide-stimulated promoter family protein [Dehalococcoidales bacterium]
MTIFLSRMARERRTISAMIALYCNHKHSSPELCPDCRTLRDYALERLQKCPFQHKKPACTKCPVHCYQPALRDRIRAVMRYAGPRMMSRYPLLAVFHLRDRLRKAPPAKS